MLLTPQPRQIEFHPGRVTLAGCQTTPRLDPDRIGYAEGYRLCLTADGVEIVAHDPAGLFYAQQTWIQLQRHAAPRWGGDGTLPPLTIEDRPDFAARGVMLDVSRDKVPTLDTLRLLVDQLAHFKINQLQLYTEHTFAYAGHESVWRDASPYTAAEMRELDAYCAERFVALVPNQNCFGHMERWLKHPGYAQLSERPAFRENDDVPAFYVGRVAHGTMGHAPGQGSTLCPVEPQSLELIDDLFGQLLPCFTAKLVNVGGDETFDLGFGRSRNACENKGKGRVYLDYLEALHRRARQHGRTMMFWGDMAWHHPELLPEVARRLPGAVALNWGYETHQTFEKEAKLCADAGLPFYVCPATASFNTFTGRYDTGLINQRHAAKFGLRHGAAGYLNTWWGDWGHWQPKAVNDPALLLGAAVSWCETANRDLDVPAALSQHLYDDPSGQLAAALAELGGVERDVAPLETPNPLNWAFVLPDQPMAGRSLDRGWDQVGPFTDAMLDAIDDRLERGVTHLKAAEPDTTEGPTLIAELEHAAAMMKHLVANLRARIRENAAHHADLAPPTRAGLAEELEALLETFDRVWLSRNRPGGRSDSRQRLDTVLDQYRR